MDSVFFSGSFQERAAKGTHRMPAKHGDVIEATTLDETLRRMRAKLAGIVPEPEIAAKAELAFQINQMKKERNAVILGHNYMEPALYHSVPDYVGDSLELSRISTQTDADVIIFCGVQFMAETAKVLNPQKTVLIPAEKAGCSLAEGITPEDVLALKAIYPGAPVVTYVNTYASVKAVSDYCCTSGNAGGVLKHLLAQGHKQIIFLPDEYLARNTARDLGVEYVAAQNPLEGAPEFAGASKDVQTIIGWRSRCEVHELYKVEDVENARKQYPGVVILAHPECHPDVISIVDYAGSTKGMIEYVKTVEAPRYLLLTECTMGDNIAAEFPHREMVRACTLRCKHMNLITLEQTLASLQNLQYQITLPADIIEKARLPIDRMLSIH
jgi:quinolinate synthase